MSGRHSDVARRTMAEQDKQQIFRIWELKVLQIRVRKTHRILYVEVE